MASYDTGVTIGNPIKRDFHQMLKRVRASADVTLEVNERHCIVSGHSAAVSVVLPSPSVVGFGVMVMVEGDGSEDNITVEYPSGTTILTIDSDAHAIVFSNGTEWVTIYDA